MLDPKISSCLQALARDHRRALTVILPAVGEAFRVRAEACLQCLRDQTGIDAEIVVTSDGSVGDSLHAHVIVVPFAKSESGLVSLGRLRNEAVSASSGRWLFFCDADIILPRRDYLARLLAAITVRANTFLACPPRHRIMAAGLERLSSVLSFGVEVRRCVVRNPGGFWRFCWAVNHRESLVKRVRQGHLELADPAELERWAEEPPEFRNACYGGSLWGGGLVVSRAAFDLVGGFAEDFIGWGPEDADLRDKLAQVQELRLLYRDKELRGFDVFHIEHSVPHRSPGTYFTNLSLRSCRRGQPLLSLVNHDLLSGKSEYARELRAAHPWCDQLNMADLADPSRHEQGERRREPWNAS
jgi:glycosyltransferase involved in cell wall biosynthesis